MADILVSKNKIEKVNLWLQVAAVYLVLVSMFAAFFSVFTLEISVWQVLIVIGIAVIMAAIILKKPKKRIWILCLFGLFYKNIYQGVLPYINSYINLSNSFYHTQNSLLEVDEYMEKNTLLVLGMLSVLIAFLLLYIVNKKRYLFLGISTLLIPVILSAVVGKLPNVWNGWFLILAAFLLVLTYHRAKQMMIFIGCFVLLFGISYLAGPIVKDIKMVNYTAYEEVKNKIIEEQKKGRKEFKRTVNRIKNGSGGFGEKRAKDGTLSKSAYFRATGETSMEIVLNERPRRTLYLKGYVGSKYTGDAWKEISKTELEEMIPKSGGDQAAVDILNEPFRRMFEGDNRKSPKKIQIKLVNASAKYGYAPYFAEVTKDMKVHLDSYVEGNRSKKREYTFYTEPADIYYHEYLSSLDVTSSSLHLDGLEEYWWAADPSEIWLEYAEFVKQAYTHEYPELERIREACGDPGADYATGVVDRMLSQGFSYSVMPGEMPEDMDLIEGFLFEKKVGFCVHYASAATVIYQILGVPARYVEGYAINPDQYVRYADGTFRATVTDEDAHAWCETFSSEVGWVVREHTKGYGEERDQSIHNLEQSDPEKNEIEVPEEEMEQQEEILEEENPQLEQENVENSENKEAQGGLFKEEKNSEKAGMSPLVKKFLRIVLWIVLTAMVLMLLLLSQAKIRRAKKLKSFTKKQNNEGVLSIYNAICDICVFEGFANIERLNSGIFRQLAETFPQITEKEWEWIYECAEKAAFADIQYEGKELKQMYYLYKKFRKSVLSEMSRSKKIWFLYGKAM